MSSGPSLGAGISPMGTGAYGYGTPAVAPTPGGTVNRDSRGNQLGSPAISTTPGTAGQYIFDSFGRRMGMPSVQQLVILATATIKGTCCVADLGNEFFNADKITDSYESDQKARVQECLKDLVQRKLIEINSIFTVKLQDMRVYTRVHITDLTTLNPIDLAIPSNP